MRTLSNKTMEICRNSRHKVNEEMVHTVIQGGNTVVFSKLCTALLYLDIDLISAESEEDKRRAMAKALLQIRGLRRDISNDCVNYISGEEVKSYLDLIIAALEAGIAPMSAVLLGTEEGSIEELERLEHELRCKRIIRGGKHGK